MSGSGLRAFESRRCRNCNELTFVKPWNGEPSYCGVCGEDLDDQDRRRRVSGSAGGGA